MNDCRHAFNRRRQRVGAEYVSFDCRNSNRKFLVWPHKSTAINTGFDESLQESRSNETRTASYQNCHISFLSFL
jgi:hypothetical protein